jgi:hypothetical protein
MQFQPVNFLDALPRDDLLCRTSCVNAAVHHHECVFNAGHDLFHVMRDQHDGRTLRQRDRFVEPG